MTSSFALFSPQSRQPEKPLFIFLPGMDGTGKLLYTQLDELEQDFDVRCLRLPADDLSSWEELVQRAAHLITQERRSQPQRLTYLCGESFGGCLALKLAAAYPACCDQLILINPASSYPRRPWVRWGGSVTSLLPKPLYQLSTWGLLPLLAALDRLRDRDRLALITAMQSVTQVSAAWRISLLQRFAIATHELRQIRQPVLLIAGERDLLLPSLEEALRLRSILPVAHVHRLPNSGHACLLESNISLYKILQEAPIVMPKTLSSDADFVRSAPH